MKIAIINKHYEDLMGGSELQCDFIAKGLKSVGHDIIYIAVGGEKTTYAANYKVVPVPNEPSAIIQACLSFRPDLVYWRYNKRLFLPTVRKLKKLNMSIVFAVAHINDIHRFSYKPQKNKPGIIKYYNKQKEILKSAWNYFGFKYVDGITVNNSDYLNHLPVYKQVYIPNSMTVEAKPFSWPRPFCLWAASIKLSKNPEHFVELAQNFMDEKLDFIMVGQIQHKYYENYLDSKTKRIPNLYYLGQKSLEEVNGMLKESLFLIHTCDPEGFSNNMIQAWLQNRPVVSLYFDPGGYIESEEIGFYSRNVQQFTDDVKKLIQDNELRKTMGNKAREFAFKHFNPEYNIRRLEKFFMEIVGSMNN